DGARGVRSRDPPAGRPGRRHPAQLPLRVHRPRRPRDRLRAASRVGRGARIGYGRDRGRGADPDRSAPAPLPPPSAHRAAPSDTRRGVVTSPTPVPTDTVPRLLADPPVATLDEHVARGGGGGLRRALELGPEATIDELRRAGLRGRGGAGFPTAIKWRSVLTGGGTRRYAVCNAAEGEPGTIKDRALLRANPYAVLECLLAAAHTVGAAEAHIARKASFEPELARVRTALAEIEQAGWLGDLAVTVTAGPEEYLFGEEKALLEVIEGNEPLPRWLPPYLHGLYATAPQLGWDSAEPDTAVPGEGDGLANPTLVNNAETLAQAAWILAHGADEFRSLGTAESPGTVICTVVGDVDRPAVVE